MTSSKNSKDKEIKDDIELVDDEITEHRFGKDAKKLREELAKASEERTSYLDGWQRAKADLINYKRTAEEDVRRAFDRGATSVIADTLPVLDSFDLAMADKNTWESAPKNWREGVAYIRQQLLDVLKDHGIEPFSPEGEPFDPHEHESIGTVPVEKDTDADTVVDVVQKGYRQNGNIIRPARVHIGIHEK